MRRIQAALVVALLAGLGWAGVACNDTLLPNAVYDNFVDTVTLSAIDGTPVASPSGYALVPPFARPVRTDSTAAVWDFVFNIDAAGRVILIPSTALHVATGAGLQIVTGTSFAGLVEAPGAGYRTDSATVVARGDVVAVRSRLINCVGLGNVFYYGKLRVLSIDLTARQIEFESLSDVNCGYRSLEPGRPKR